MLAVNDSKYQHKEYQQTVAVAIQEDPTYGMLDSHFSTERDNTAASCV